MDVQKSKMNYGQLLQLAAKDNIVIMHGDAILKWSTATWLAAVRGATKDLFGVHGSRLRQRYPDA